MTLLTNYPPELDPDVPYVRADGWTPKQSSPEPTGAEPPSLSAASLGGRAGEVLTSPLCLGGTEGGQLSIPHLLSAIDVANAIITHNETIADQLDQAANTLTAMATKLRHQANAIRSNRQRVNAALYPATTSLRQLLSEHPEVLH